MANDVLSVSVPMNNARFGRLLSDEEVAADALSRGFQTYRRTNGYELPFQTGLGRSVIHEPESMARVWEALAHGFEKVSGTGESAPGKITRLSGVYDINALGANHDDVGRTNMNKWMDIWRETGYLPVSSIYGTGETTQPVVQPSGKTLRVPVPGTVNPWSMKSHFTGVVPVERQDGRYVDVGRNYSAGTTADLVNMNARTLGTTFQLISEPAFLNTVLQPVIRESQTTTPVGPALGGGHVLRGSKVFQPGEAARRTGWGSPRWDAKGGNARKSVRAAEEGGDAGGLETAVSETPVSKGGSVPEGYRGPRIVINPTTFRNKKDALCVAFNEAFRVVMEDMGFDPVAEPTDRQRKFFSDTAYADDETQLRRTILARICTFDTSVKDPTDEQLQEAVEFLESVMEAGYPQNEWEQSAVQRIHDVVERTVGAPRADEAPEEAPEPPSAPAGEGAVQAAEGAGESQESDDSYIVGMDGSDESATMAAAQQARPTEAERQLMQLQERQPQQPWQPAAGEEKEYQKTATGAPNQYSQLSREDRNRARMYRAHHMSGADANRMAGVTYSGIYTTNAGLNGALARPDKYTGKTPTQQRSTAMVPAARPVASTWDDFELANRRRRRMWGDVD